MNVIGNATDQICSRWLNNRVENSHQPFGQRGSAIFFEGFAAVEMTVEIKMIVDRGMDGSEFSRVFTSQNFDIAPSRRLNGWCEFSARLLSQRPHS